MRYIPITFLKENMVLGKDIYGEFGEIYLRKETTLSHKYIRHLERLGYLGAYIEDEISEGIEFVEIIGSGVRHEAVNKVHDIYESIKTNNKNIYRDWDDIDNLTTNIVGDIISNDKGVYNISYIKQYDDYTYTHCVNVALIAAIIGKKSNMSKAALIDLFKSALMHDVGKLFIPLSILNKPGRLSIDEFELMKQHTTKGYDYLVEQGYLSPRARRGVLQHHEYHNGKGYPYGISDSAISLYAKYLCICDVYDALVSERPYRKAWTQAEAFEYIMANTGTMFDPVYTKLFFENITPYIPGSIVELSNNAKAVIVSTNKELPLRPRVRIFEEDGKRVGLYEVDLSTDRDYLNIVISKELLY